MTRGILVACAALLAVLCLAPPAEAQDRDFPGWDRIPTRDRLLADRGAQIRGLRDLSRVLLNLPVAGGTIADLVGPDAAGAAVAGRIIEGYEVDEPRRTGDGFTRVAVRLSTEQAWENLLAIAPAIAGDLTYGEFRRAVGDDAIEVEGLGRPRGFPADLRAGDVPPVPEPRERKHGLIPGLEDERFGQRQPRERALEDPRERALDPERERALEDARERFAEREVPRERPLPDRFEDRAAPGDDGGWRVVEDSGWRTVSEEIVRTWDAAPGGACRDHAGAGEWEVVEERVIERRVLSESVVVR